MSKLVGIKWGMLEKTTQEWLLKDCNCVNGATGGTAYNGDCIVDLTENLSVAGKIVNGDIVIDDDAKIYDPEGEYGSDGTTFEINNIMTVSEAAEIWGITEGAIRKAIKSGKFIPNIDYRKAGRITLICREAMERVYGESKGSNNY